MSEQESHVPTNPPESGVPIVSAPASPEPPAHPVATSPMPPSPVAPPPYYPVPEAPVSAYPVSAYPVSAYPVSGYPVSGVAWTPEPPRIKGRPAAWTLGIISAVLLILGGLGGALFYTNLNDWNQTIADNQAQIDSSKQTVKEKDDQLEARGNALTKAKSDLRNEKAHLTRLTACEKAVQDFFSNIGKNDLDAADNAALSMMRNCD
jgi:hypothetical protein